MKAQVIAVALLVGAFGLLGSHQDSLAQTIELKVSMFAPPSNAWNRELVKVASEVEEKSKGRLKLALFHTGQLGPPPRQFDLVRTGVADIAYVLAGLTPGRFPLSELVIMPGLAPTGLVGGRAMVDMGDDYLKEWPGVRMLAPAYSPPVAIHTKNEVRKLADFKGMRIRHSGPIQAAAIASIGAVPVAVQPADVGDALSRGQIDGAAAGYGAVTSFKWQESLRYFTRISMGGALFGLVMNPDAYNKLPDDLKKLVDDVIAQPDRWNRLLDQAEAEDRGVLLREGTKEVVLNDADMATYNAAVAKIWDEVVGDLEKKGLPARAYFEKLKAVVAKHSR